MADPLSLTLAAITLATAIKDVIELAQKLNDSFKQVRKGCIHLVHVSELTLRFPACSQPARSKVSSRGDARNRTGYREILRTACEDSG